MAMERCPVCRKLMLYEGKVDGKDVWSCLDHGEQTPVKETIAPPAPPTHPWRTYKETQSPGTVRPSLTPVPQPLKREEATVETGSNTKAAVPASPEKRKHRTPAYWEEHKAEVIRDYELMKYRDFMTTWRLCYKQWEALKNAWQLKDKRKGRKSKTGSACPCKELLKLRGFKEGVEAMAIANPGK